MQKPNVCNCATGYITKKLCIIIQVIMQISSSPIIWDLYLCGQMFIKFTIFFFFKCTKVTLEVQKA